MSEHRRHRSPARLVLAACTAVALAAAVTACAGDGDGGASAGSSATASALAGPPASASGTPRSTLPPAVPKVPFAPDAVVTTLPTPAPWDRDRLLHALAAHGGDTRTARSDELTARVGAIFSQAGSKDHFCTGSVVASPGHSLVLTAAHCVHGGKGGGYDSDAVFVPDYRNGNEPQGEWPVRSIVVDQRWIDSSDPDLDVAFLVLGTVGGRSIEDVLGANKLGVNLGFGRTVLLTGYPSDADAPIACLNSTTRQSTYQMRIACQDFPGGTSGSPWITGFDRATRSGTVIGVIGGYQQGGDSPDVSYSPYFDNDVLALYNRATNPAS